MAKQVMISKGYNERLVWQWQLLGSLCEILAINERNKHPTIHIRYNTLCLFLSLIVQRNDFIADLCVYLFAATVAVPISKRLGLGSVLGYLLVGIAIGPWWGRKQAVSSMWQNLAW